MEAHWEGDRLINKIRNYFEK
jgi:hypothetical protein